MLSPITPAQAKRNFVSPYSRWHQKEQLPGELDGTLASQRLRKPLFSPAISPGFKMQREDKIFAIGSCFARGVELALIGNDLLHAQHQEGSTLANPEEFRRNVFVQLTWRR